MTFIDKVSGVVEGVQEHPLAKNPKYKREIYRRIIKWQMTKHFYPDGKRVQWINDLYLWIVPGRASGVGNYYYGLYEYDIMAFMYHYITDEDVVYDIGANVGAYSVLSKAAKAIFAFEPGKDTFEVMKKNIEANEMQNVTLINKGVSNINGRLMFTKGLDCVNHIVDEKEADADCDYIDVVSLDSFTKDTEVPSVIKIDTEGAEESIVEGALTTLSDNRVNAIIVEIFGSEKLSQQLEKLGFKLYLYDSSSRTLVEGTAERAGDNGIYIRNIELARKKVKQGNAIIYRNNTIG